MELGKIARIKLESNDMTTYMVDRLSRTSHSPVDTLCLDGMCDVWHGKGDLTKIGSRAYFGGKAFNISFYIQKYSLSSVELKPNITFTDLKRKYRGQVYHTDDPHNGILASEICRGVVEHLDINVDQTIDYQFEKSIVIRAQSNMNHSDGFGRTSEISIVGINIRRWY